MDGTRIPGVCDDAKRHVALVYRYGPIDRPRYICAEHLRERLRRGGAFDKDKR